MFIWSCWLFYKEDFQVRDDVVVDFPTAPERLRPTVNRCAPWFELADQSEPFVAGSCCPPPWLLSNQPATTGFSILFELGAALIWHSLSITMTLGICQKSEAATFLWTDLNPKQQHALMRTWESLWKEYSGYQGLIAIRPCWRTRWFAKLANTGKRSWFDWFNSQLYLRKPTSYHFLFLPGIWSSR